MIKIMMVHYLLLEFINLIQTEKSKPIPKVSKFK